MRKERITHPVLFIIITIVSMFSSPLHIIEAAVSLVSFNAIPGNGQVVLEWETATETDMLGFYINRANSSNGNYTRVSPFIFTQGTAISGLTYQFVDSNLTNGSMYYYKLEAVDIEYNSEFFGPVSASPFLLTVTGTQTLTATSLTQSPTTSRTPTITLTTTINLTSSKTPTRSSTSPFSFFTNTSTSTATITPRVSPSQTFTTTPEYSVTPEVSRTFEIISYNNITPTITSEPVKPGPFRQGLMGFFITLIVGVFLIITIIVVQRNRSVN